MPYAQGDDSRVRGYSKKDRIVDDIIRRIKAREWLPRGDALPSTSVLARQYRVSQEPVRQAMKELRDQGWIVGVRGSGRYVADPPPEPLDTEPPTP